MFIGVYPSIWGIYYIIVSGEKPLSLFMEGII